MSDIDEWDVIDSNIYVEQDKIKAYKDANRLIYTWLIDENNINYTNEDILSFEENSKIGIRGGYFEKSDNQTYNAIDFNKAYTWNLYDMDMIPVFTRFDLFLNYDGHKIEDYTQYYIYCEDKSIEYAILFNKKYSRHYGYMLNRKKYKL